MTALLPALLATLAHAGDTWTTIRPGIDHLHRTTSEPQDIYAVRVDLSQPNIGLHASADSDGVERHVTTPTFARNADVLVAINGDWSDGNTPVGLAISDGMKWHDHIVDDTVGGEWGFLACTPQKECTLDAELPLDQAWWFAMPTISPYRYWQSVGANGVVLLRDGVALSGCYDSSDNPRSAACLEADGTHLWLVAVDGRTGSAAGMTCDETRSLLLDLGCSDAVMLDGGGSTTLVIDDEVMNNPSDGSPRTVSNHFGIVYRDTVDTSCEVPNGLWCTGTVIHACQGGRPTGEGDCAAYGATCQEDGDHAFCVDYRCPGGDGMGASCADATNIVACTDGVYGGGDCAAFGLVCGTDAAGSDCMDARCAAGPHSSFCVDSSLLATCTDGLYAEAACPEGWTCEGSACVDPNAADSGDSGDSGGENGGENGGESGGESGGSDEDAGPGATSSGPEGGCGCAATDPSAGFGWVLLAVGLAARRRG